MDNHDEQIDFMAVTDGSDTAVDHGVLLAEVETDSDTFCGDNSIDEADGVMSVESLGNALLSDEDDNNEVVSKASDAPYEAAKWEVGDSTIIGDPRTQREYWQEQSFADNCMPAAESAILRQCGVNVSERDAAYISASNGWYIPGKGTSIEHAGKLLDCYGINNHVVCNGSMQGLVDELKAGHGVVAFVRADQLWDSGKLNDFGQFVAKLIGIDRPEVMPANHALCITGFNLDDPENPMVILIDSGHPEGGGAEYPLAKFKDAWENGCCAYMATDNPLHSIVYASNQRSLWNQHINNESSPFHSFMTDAFARSI